MRNKNHKFFVLFFLCCAFLFLNGTLSHKASAGETVENITHNTVELPADEYHRVGTTIQITATPGLSDIDICDGSNPNITCPAASFVPSTVSVKYRCMGYSSSYPNGGWILDEATADQCWSALEVCFYPGTINYTCLPVSLTSPRHISDAGNQVLAHDSSCIEGPTSGDPNKSYCSINYNGNNQVANGTRGISGDTDDDMFKMPKATDNPGGYFVYKRPGDPDSELIYFKRNIGGGQPGKSLMVPSGPFPPDPNAFKDYKNFIENSPGFLDVEKACYPVNIQLCQGEIPDPPVVNGLCGDATDANAYYLTAPPTASPPNPTELCQRGVPTAVGGSGPWNWVCEGLDGQDNSGTLVTATDDACTAKLRIIASCGSADGQDYASAPTTNLCSSGTPGVVFGPNAWNWSCYGTPSSDPANNVSCSANRIIDGVCGAAHTNSYATATEVNNVGLCFSGSSPEVIGAGPWSWTCTGAYGGSSVPCSASLAPACPAPPTGTDENGTCGAAHGNAYSSASAVPAGQRCLTGTPTAVTDAGATLTWTCNGIGVGTSQNCSAPKMIAGSCGTANSGTFSSAPSSNLCASTGTAPTVTDTGTGWAWMCTGQGGGANAPCTASKPGPTCSTAAPVHTSANGCTSAGYTDEDADSPHYEELVGGHVSSSGFSPLSSGSCLQVVPPVNPNPGQFNLYRLYHLPGCFTPPVAGSCASFGGTYSSQPATNTSNGCAAGSYADLSDTSSNWQWRCNGLNGGANSSTCTASKPAAPVAGSCASFGGTYSSQPATNTSNGCAAGSYADLSDTSSNWQWRCNGLNGGANSSTCTASKPAPGTCGDAQYWTTTNQAQLIDIGLCDSGSASAVTSPNSSTWAWTCGSTACTAGRCTNGTPGAYGAAIRLIDWDGWVGDGCYNENQMIQQLKYMNGGTFPPNCGTAAANNTSNMVCITQRITAGGSACGSAYFIGYDGRQRSMVGGNCPPPPQSGICGSENGDYVTDQPTGTEACFSGSTITNMSVSGSPSVWTWNCVGEPGGATRSCSAREPSSSMCYHSGAWRQNGATWGNGTASCDPPGPSTNGSMNYYYQCNSGTVDFVGNCFSLD